VGALGNGVRSSIETSRAVERGLDESWVLSPAVSSSIVDGAGGCPGGWIRRCSWEALMTRRLAAATSAAMTLLLVLAIAGTVFAQGLLFIQTPSLPLPL